MPKSVIVDTSCFIVLSKIGRVDLLNQIYPSIKTTTEVADEFHGSLPNWVKIISSDDTSRQPILELEVDKGEASIMAYALEHPDHILIMDDIKARKLAENLALKIAGTVGVTINANFKF